MANGLLTATNNLATNPLFNLGIGLLQGARPGGSFAGGAQAGLMNMQNAMQMQQRQQLTNLQAQKANLELAKQRREQEANARAQELMGGLLGAPAGPDQPFEQDLFPGEAPTPGLLTAGAPATGMYAQDPQSAALMEARMQVDAPGLLEQMTTPPDPTKLQEGIAEYQYLRSIGAPDDEARRSAFGGGGVNVYAQGGPPVPPDQQFLADYTAASGKGLISGGQDAGEAIRSAGVGKEMLRQMSRAGTETGAWMPFQAGAARWLGMNPELVQNYQMFMNQAGRQVMNTIQQTKGAVSEKEMTYFEKINIGADKDPFTNFVLLEIQERAARRQQAMPHYYGEYLQKNKGSAIGFEDWYMKNHDPYKGEFDLDQIRNQYQSEIKGTGGALSPEAMQEMRDKGYVE